MPRHRKERVPLYRARRRTGSPHRRAGLNAAVADTRPARDRSAAEASWPEDVVAGPVPAGSGPDMSGPDGTAAGLVLEPSPQETSWPGEMAAWPAVDGSAPDLSWPDELPVAGPAVVTDLPSLSWGAELSAAGPVQASWPDDRTAAETMPLPAHGRSRRGHSRSPGNKPGLLRVAGRGMLVNPWFATGTGFVVAAAMWMYLPHAVLRFPLSQPAITRCKQTGCGPGGGGLPLGTGSPGVARADNGAGKTVQNPDAKRSQASQFKFVFSVLWQKDGGFMAVIGITAIHPIGDWKLTFFMPRDQIIYVSGAEWHASGSDGGTASGNTPFGSGNHQGGYRSGSGQRQVSFTINGTGKPSLPSGCVFNGARCTFSVGGSGD